MLKYIIENLEDIEDPKIRELYKETSDGKFMLDIEGVKPTEEFNKVHEALRKERELHRDWEKKAKMFGDLTPENIEEFKTKIAELEATKGSEDVEAIKKSLKEHYEARMAVINSESKNKLGEKDLLVKDLESKLTSFKLDKELMDLCKDVAKPESISDALALLKAGVIWDEDTGDFVASDGVTTLKDFTIDFFKNRPYFVASSEGGGAKGSKGSINSPSDWTKLNMTEQGLLLKQNPVLAEKLRRKAGLIA